MARRSKRRASGRADRLHLRRHLAAAWLSATQRKRHHCDTCTAARDADLSRAAAAGRRDQRMPRRRLAGVTSSARESLSSVPNSGGALAGLKARDRGAVYACLERKGFLAEASAQATAPQVRREA